MEEKGKVEGNEARPVRASFSSTARPGPNVTEVTIPNSLTHQEIQFSLESLNY